MVVARRKDSLRRSSIMNYEQSVMFGQYREQLASFARDQAMKQSEMTGNEGEFHGRKSGVTGLLLSILNHYGEWILLAFLGLLMAFISFLFDLGINSCYNFRTFLMEGWSTNYWIRYSIWISFPLGMILTSTIIVRMISPQAAGSGISEMKVILRGTVLHEYLSFRTLISKILALPIAVGSGFPIGKQGPCVHISAMISVQMLKVLKYFTHHDYDSKFLEITAVACAVGISSTFASPIGGLLFSIEIVSTFFSMHSYWQGFFAASWGALAWGVLTVLFGTADNITNVFKTSFRIEMPYETLEIVTFAILGILCGIITFCLILLLRLIVRFNRGFPSKLFNLNPLIYPTLVTIVISSLTYPDAGGKYFASWLPPEKAMHELFSNKTWTGVDFYEEDPVIDNWRTENTTVHMNTAIFVLVNLFLVSLSSTLPVPLGMIMPCFMIGAGLGRCFGETLVLIFPTGINPNFNRTTFGIIPGAYAVAGAGAFAGGATGALSSAVIALEMTGQLTHLLPTLVAVIISNLVARRLGPSIYETLIELKKLPHLPTMIQKSSAAHKVLVQDFMDREILYVWPNCTYRYLKHLIDNNLHWNEFPFLKSPETMIFLGTISRSEIEFILSKFLNHRQRTELAKARIGKQQNPLTSVPTNNNNENEPKRISMSFDEVRKNPLILHAWEEEQLNHEADFSSCTIDPVPVHIVEGTSLMKVHTLFSLLGLQVAYVTSLGRLTGVITLTELRKAIDDLNDPMSQLSRRKTIFQSRSNRRNSSLMEQTSL